MKAARTIVTGIANAFAVAGLSLLLILAVFTLLDGLLRAIANTPIDLVREIGDMVAAICGTCCLPIVLLHRNNIVLRLFDRILPPSAVRVRTAGGGSRHSVCRRYRLRRRGRGDRNPALVENRIIVTADYDFGEIAIRHRRVMPGVVLLAPSEADR